MEKEELDNYKKAGKIISEARSFAKEYVKSGMKILDIANAVEDKIRELGAEPAFPVNTDYGGIAAHKTPLPGTEEVAQGLFKVDLGAQVNGYIADTAVTMDLTENNEYKEQLDLNQELLKVGKETITAEVQVGQIGTNIYKSLEEYNEKNNTKYTIISGLTGHGLDKDTIHTSPNIPNYPNTS
ncbi:MAG: methionyl aminopeptidase, partial [Patescibacteria group bacterium]